MSVLFAAASALVLVGFGALLYKEIEDALAARQRQPLIALATVLRNMMDDIPSVEYFGEHPNAVGHLLGSHPLMSLRIYGEDGRTLFASAHTVVPKEAWASLVPADAQEVGVGLWQPASHSAYRLAVARFGSERPEIGRGLIVLALDASEPLRLLRAFRTSVLVAVPAAVLIVGLIGFFIVRAGLWPIARVAESARHVTASHLSERLDLTGVPAELQDLASSFNTMLERLEGSFRRLSDFSADLAHELRTPLTSLLGRTRLVLSKNRSAGEYREALELSVGEMERLAALASYMLFLAQADHAPVVLARDNVDLRDEADRLIEFFGIAAEERGIALQAHGRATVSADRAMLRQALSNLLRNALEACAGAPAPPRIAIHSDVDHAQKRLRIVVSDNGSGIAPELRERVFHPFFTSKRSGTGLGLALVQKIIVFHNGRITAGESPLGGASMHITLPLAK